MAAIPTQDKQTIAMAPQWPTEKGKSFSSSQKMEKPEGDGNGGTRRIDVPGEGK